MNILYCGDKGIERGTLISILSLLKHNSPTAAKTSRSDPAPTSGSATTSTPEPLHIYIMTIHYDDVTPFSTHATKFLNSLVKKYNHHNFVKLLDATTVFTASLPSKNMGSYFTPCSMLRLYADQMPELAKLDRILYLDYDVLCRANLSEFYHTDLTGIEAAGVLDIYGRWFYHYHGLFRQDYMNSGVMLFNMRECRRTGMFARAVQLCIKRWMMLADQAALNKAISHRKLMPRRYNDQAERPHPDTVLHHFSNNFKFWPYFHVQKVKPFEVDKIHQILGITEYDDLLAEYKKLAKNLSL